MIKKISLIVILSLIIAHISLHAIVRPNKKKEVGGIAGFIVVELTNKWFEMPPNDFTRLKVGIENLDTGIKYMMYSENGTGFFFKGNIPPGEYQILNCTGEKILGRYKYNLPDLDLSPADIRFTLEGSSISALPYIHVYFEIESTEGNRYWYRYNYALYYSYYEVMEKFIKKDKKDFWKDFTWSYVRNY